MNRSPFLCAGLALAILSSVCTASFAAKPNPKNKATKGTTQLKASNDHPVFGTTYTLGKANPINITVNSAEYTLEQVTIDKTPYLLGKDQKLLVIHYTLHNPNKSDYGLGWGTLEIFGVDAVDKNWRYVAAVGIEGTGENCNMNLKPGQKTKVYTAIILPRQGPLPKLVMQSRDRLVLRFNLLEKDKQGKLVNPVKPLPATVADPSDPTGATASEEIAGVVGQFYPLREYDAKVDSLEFSEEPIKGKAPKSGNRYLIATVTARNDSPRKLGFVWSTIHPELVDGDGGTVRLTGGPLFASRDDDAKGDINPGGEMRIRFYYQVPTGLGLKSFSIKQGADGKPIAYDLTAMK